MKNVCIITGARSEYGLLRWLIDDLSLNPRINLQLIVTGAHLLEEQGFTYREIEKDGYHIDAFVDMQLDVSSQLGIAKSMGYCGIGCAEAFDKLNPDLLVVLGDRYELLPICSTALVMGIPIAHISGGDITEGAIDDAVRNAVTMMADIHFPGNADSAANIARMRGSGKDVFNVGEPGLDNFTRLSLMTRQDLAENLDIKTSKKWVLMTYHPETKITLEENIEVVRNIIAELDSIEDIEVVITKANADFGGKQINDYLQGVADKNPDKYKIFASLGQLRYVSFMKQASLVVGNSSSGIFEAPFCGVPVINIGNRQKGRYLCSNIINTNSSFKDIFESKSQNNNITNSLNDCAYYGDGSAATRMAKHIDDYLWR